MDGKKPAERGMALGTAKEKQREGPNVPGQITCQGQMRHHKKKARKSAMLPLAFG